VRVPVVGLFCHKPRLPSFSHVSFQDNNCHVGNVLPQEFVLLRIEMLTKLLKGNNTTILTHVPGIPAL
jgi:hypothetical protein